MIFRYSKTFLKNYKKLPKTKQDKVNKQLIYLQENFHHPSLRTKKTQGRENTFEFRVNSHYRMTAEKQDEELVFKTVGPHDERLGKK